MNQNRPVLTDALLREALMELAAGPDAGEVTASVTRSVATTPQRNGLAWPVIDLGRRTTLILVAGLLLAGLAAALAVYSGALPRPVPLPVVPSTVVTQVSNGRGGDAYAEIHTAFPPGSVTGTTLALGNLPANAVGLRWSPDGSRLAYFTREAPNVDGLSRYTGIFVANGDGSDPTQLELAHDMGMFWSSGYWNGVMWAPSGDRLAVEWVRTVCLATDCPDGDDDYYHGIEIFDAAGAPIAAWDAGLDWAASEPTWSPDSAAMGWMGFRNDGCGDTCFNWRTLTDEAVTSVLLASESSNRVTWSTDNRLQVVEYHSEGGLVTDEGYHTDFGATDVPDRVYSMNPDGTDVRDVAWGRPQVPEWSPDGRLLVAVDDVAGELVVLDLASGEETIVSIPTGAGIVQWGPEGDRVMLGGSAATGAGSLYDLYLVNLDGSNTQPLGRAVDFGWMPASVAEGAVAD